MTPAGSERDHTTLDEDLLRLRVGDRKWIRHFDIHMSNKRDRLESRAVLS